MELTGNNFGKYIEIKQGKWTKIASSVTSGIVTKDEANVFIRAALVTANSSYVL